MITLGMEYIVIKLEKWGETTMKNVVYPLGMILMLWLSGCGAKQEEPPLLNVAKSSSKYQLVVNMEPNPARTLKENEMHIRLKDLQSQYITDAVIIVSLSMKSMDHGDLTIDANPTGEGDYVAKVIPVMAGEWIAEITAKLQHDTVQTQYVFEAKR